MGVGFWVLAIGPCRAVRARGFARPKPNPENPKPEERVSAVSAISAVISRLALGVVTCAALVSAAGCNWISEAQMKEMLAQERLAYEGRQKPISEKITAVQTVVNDLDGRLGRLRDTIEGHRKRFEDLKKEVDTTRSQVDEAIAKQLERVKQTQTDVAALQERAKKLLEKVDENARSLAECLKDLEALKKQTDTADNLARTSYNYTRDLLDVEMKVFLDSHNRAADLKKRLDQLEAGSGTGPATQPLAP